MRVAVWREWRWREGVAPALAAPLTELHDMGASSPACRRKLLVAFLISLLSRLFQIERFNVAVSNGEGMSVSM